MDKVIPVFGPILNLLRKPTLLGFPRCKRTRDVRLGLEDVCEATSVRNRHPGALPEIWWLSMDSVAQDRNLTFGPPIYVDQTVPMVNDG